MNLDALSELLLLGVSGVILPLIAWFGRGLYDSWTRDDIYISLVPGCGQAPGGFVYGHPNDVVALSWQIRVRVLNLSDKLLALERIYVRFRWHSDHLPHLTDLIDHNAKVALVSSPDEFTEELPPAAMPVLIPTKGRPLYLDIRAQVRLYRRRWLVFQSPLSYPMPGSLSVFKSQEEQEELKAREAEFAKGLRPMEGEWVRARISGKLRTYHIKLHG